MRAWRFGIAALGLAVACGEFRATEPEPSDGGSDAAFDAGPLDAGNASDAAAAAIVVRGVSSNEPTGSTEVQLPPGTKKGDFLWATVLAKPFNDPNGCVATGGWTMKRKQSAVACSTVYSEIFHLFRVATDAEPAMQMPCVVTAPSGVSATVLLAAFGGVDSAQPFEDFQAYGIPQNTGATSTLTAPAATAQTGLAETFAVFVDPDGNGDSMWTVPSGVTERAATTGVALFVAAADGSGSVPARETHKAVGARFCPTAEALNVVLHPKF